MEEESTSDMPAIVTPLNTAWLNVVRYALAYLE